MITYRTARVSDGPAIAALHAESWRNHYRGTFSDQYLDELAHADRLEVWTKRLRENLPQRRVIGAYDGTQLAGFICVELDKDPVFGALLDNLHVDRHYQGRGIGKTLIGQGAEWIVEKRPQSGLYLYVLTANTTAVAVYTRLGGQRQAELAHDGGSGDRVQVYRYVWPRAATLISA